MDFIEKIEQAEKRNNSFLCVGLDPSVERFCDELKSRADGIFQFNKAIVDATSDLVLAYKPQIAYYSALRAEDQLLDTINYIHETTSIPVILDAKRGDIGSTAEMYAKEAFEVFNADAVTVNPFLGLDSLEPFLKYKDKGIILLCRTSNPGGAELQGLRLEDGSFLYERVARSAATIWNQNKNVLVVAGATNPLELKRIRELVGTMTLLIPGIGAQGGDIKTMIENVLGGGIIVNSSRAILYASEGPDFAEAARVVALETRDTMNNHLYKLTNDLRA